MHFDLSHFTIRIVIRIFISIFAILVLLVFESLCLSCLFDFEGTSFPACLGGIEDLLVLAYLSIEIEPVGPVYIPDMPYCADQKNQTAQSNWTDTRLIESQAEDQNREKSIAVDYADAAGSRISIESIDTEVDEKDVDHFQEHELSVGVVSAPYDGNARTCSQCQGQALPSRTLFFFATIINEVHWQSKAQIAQSQDG